MADLGTSQPSLSREPIPGNNNNNHYYYLYLVGSIFLENANAL